MDIGKAIYKILSDDIAVESLVSTRISPNIMKQTSAFPFIVYDVSNDNPEGQKDSVALLDIVSIMVSGYSKNYAEASKLANYIRTALDRVSGNYNGVNIQAIDFQGYDDIFDDSSGSDGIYRKALNFNVRVINSLNNIYSTNFDGVDDYVALGVSGMDAMTTSGSISAWFKLETTSVSCEIMRIFEDSDNFVRIIYHDTSSELRSYYKAGGTATLAFTTDEVEGDGLWHHVASTWENPGNLKIYLDGTLKDTTAITGTFSGTFTTAAIGNDAEGGTYWNGNIDEVSIYNAELSAANVTTLYNDGFPDTVGGDTGLIGWWRMGDGGIIGNPIATPPTIPDETGNNDGTMTNMAGLTDFQADVPSG